MTDAHEEKETLHVEVDIPEHADRTETPLFERTRTELIARDKACWVCGTTKDLQAHHHPIERCMTGLVDWPRFIRDAEAGAYGPHAQAFDWQSFDQKDPYTFVDDMLHNGLLLCEEHHIGPDAGIHTVVYPLWIAQQFAKAGYRFSPTEKIIHEAP